MEHESSFNLESNEGSEKVILTAQENAILHALTPEDIEKVRELKTENLTQESKNIVGVRVEDFFYFLQAVHKGYLPVGNADIRQKQGENHLFLTPNPQSEYLQQERQDLAEGLRDSYRAKTFLGVTKETMKSYGRIAISQGVYRNLWNRIEDPDTLMQEFTKLHPSEAGIMVREAFFNELSREIQKKQNFINCESSRYPMAHLLAQHIDPNVPRADITKLLRSLVDRSGIIIAFNKELLHEADAVTNNSQLLDLPGEEMAVHIPSGRIPLKAILGYEILGNFEEEIEKKIGVKA